ncbi:MAG: endonuclease III [Acidobacteriia bacterium]|nr:endonuclease III [Terriglobia bacterium]
MEKKERVEVILKRLDQHYPAPECALLHRNPFQLLVATILSAQCTDERVNMVTETLFKRYRTPVDFARVRQSSLEREIRSTGFFRNKAKNIRAASRILLDQFNGTVPKTMEELLTLPGVARKTANVVLGTAYGIACGVVVDTHVGRLSGRLGLTRQKDPKKIERDLMKIIPRDRWIAFSHQLIWHGRRICQARKPKCLICPLLDVCPTGQKEAIVRGAGGQGGA